MTKAPRVIVLAGLPAVGLEMLGQGLSVEARGRQAEPGWLNEHAPGAAAIVAEPAIPVDAELMDLAGSSLKVVANFGVGHDNIDVEAARARGVRATNTPRRAHERHGRAGGRLDAGGRAADRGGRRHDPRQPVGPGRRRTYSDASLPARRSAWLASGASPSGWRSW